MYSVIFIVFITITICGVGLGYAQEIFFHYSHDIPEFKLPRVPYLKMPSSAPACSSPPKIAEISVPIYPEYQTEIIMPLPEGTLWFDGNNRKREVEKNNLEPELINWLEPGSGDCGTIILNPVSPQFNEFAQVSREFENQASDTVPFFSDIIIDEFQADYKQEGIIMVDGNVADVDVADDYVADDYVADDYVADDKSAGEQKPVLNETMILKWQGGKDVLALYSSNSVPGVIAYEDHFSNPDIPIAGTLTTIWNNFQLSLNYENMGWYFDEDIDPHLDDLSWLFGYGWQVYRYTNDQGEVVYVLINKNGRRLVITQKQLNQNRAIFVDNMFELLFSEYFGGLLPAGGGEAPEQWQQRHRIVPVSILYRIARIAAEYTEGNNFRGEMTSFRIKEAPQKKKKNKKKPKLESDKKEPKSNNQKVSVEPEQHHLESMSKSLGSIGQCCVKTRIPSKGIKDISQLRDEMNSLKKYVILIYIFMKQDINSSMFNFDQEIISIYQALLAAKAIFLSKTITRTAKLNRGKSSNKFEASVLKHEREHWEIDQGIMDQRDSQEVFVGFIEAVMGIKPSEELATLILDAIYDKKLPISIIIPGFQDVEDVEKRGADLWILPFMEIITKGLICASTKYSKYLDVVRTVSENKSLQVRIKNSSPIIAFLMIMLSNHDFLFKPEITNLFIVDGVDGRINIFLSTAKLLSLCGQVCSGNIANLQFDFSGDNTCTLEKFVAERLDDKFFDTPDQKPLVRSFFILELFLSFWRDAVQELLAEQMISQECAVGIITGFLGGMEVGSEKRDFYKAHLCFLSCTGCERLASMLPKCLRDDAFLRSRLLDAIDFYSSCLIKLLEAETTDMSEVREKKSANVCSYAKEIVTFIGDVASAFSGSEKSRLVEIGEKLNRHYQEAIDHRKGIIQKLEYDEAEKLEKQKIIESHAIKMKELEKRQRTYKTYLEKRRSIERRIERRIESSKELQELHSTSRLKENPSFKWQEKMEQAAEVLAQGEFKQAAEMISDLAFNEDDVSLRFISLVEVLLIHIHRLNEIINPLIKARARMDVFEATVTDIDMSRLEALVDENKQSLSFSEIIARFIKEGGVFYDRDDRVVYYENVQNLVGLIHENNEEIEILISEINALLESFEAFMLIEKREIEEEVRILLMGFLAQEIDVYKKNVEWLNGRTDKMMKTMSDVKKINQLIGIYGLNTEVVKSKSESTIISELCKRLKIVLVVDRGVFDRLKAILYPKE